MESKNLKLRTNSYTVFRKLPWDDSWKIIGSLIKNKQVAIDTIKKFTEKGCVCFWQIKAKTESTKEIVIVDTYKYDGEKFLIKAKK